MCITTDHRRICLEVQIVSVDHFANHALQGIPNISSLFGTQIMDGDIDERRMTVNNVVD